MAALTRLGVSNLRSLRSIDPPIRIAPITVLLGRNSVGKSTFARIFPLLRQSSERKKRSPVLWFGDLVDFGSLGRSVTEGEREIGFFFQLYIDKPSRKSAYGWPLPPKTRSKTEAKVWITLAEEPVQKIGFATKIRVDVLGGSIALDLSTPSNLATPIDINGKRLSLPSKEHAAISFQGDILPLTYFYVQQKNDAGQATWVASGNHWDDAPTQVIRNLVHQNTSTSTCRKIARQVPLGTVSEIRDAVASIPGPQTWTTVVQSQNLRENIAQQLHHALMVSHFDEILQQVDTALTTYFKGVRYLKPLRATAERFYRRLDLSVSEIDPDGSNLPMFLDSLATHELNSFRAWVKSFLGIDAYPQREGDQVMVMAQGKNDPKAFNIADMGFGISQVLPIAAQLWATTRRLPQTGSASLVVLEQPELHLHPDSQARLADVFAGTITNSSPAHGGQLPSILVETHSQYLVNRLGQLVESGVLKPDDVSVVLFEASGTTPPSTTVRISEFSDKGILLNWPYGFFEPEVD